MRTFLAALLVLALAMPSLAVAHAYPKHASPQPGATLATSPHQVRIWFNGQIEPVFSTLLVRNAAGKVVSHGKGQVDARDHKLLETTLPKPLPAGTYTVHWSVIAHDGHHTDGQFTFTVK